jgi:cell division septation protein DedD
VAIAGYLYYFTDLIRPQQEEAKPAAPASGPVKQPIPPRPGQQGGTAGTPAKPAEVKPVAGTPAPAPAAVTAPAPAPAQAPPTQKPAPVQAQSKPEPVKSAKPEPVKSAKPEPVKSAKTEPPAKAAQPPAAPPKTAPAPSQATAPATKEAASVKPVQKAEKAEKALEKRKGGGYCLLVGDYGPGKPLEAVLARLKKSGITPVRKKAVQAVEPMNRLFVAEFGDQDSAEAELQKLRKLTGDGFLLPDNGKYILYAGSYLSSGVAASEVKRLASRGVTTVVRQSRVSVKVTRVTTGSYAGAAEARSDAARLKKLGIAASLVKTK